MSNPQPIIVTINLEDSTYAHCFEEGARIHQLEYDRAIRLIDGQISFNKKRQISNKGLFERFHNTISVFGGRGTGKTSFLHSVIEHYRGNDDVEILGLIDPTIIEEKEHIFLYIIALIDEKIEKFLTEKECHSHTDAYLVKRQWREYLMKLAQGLPSLDNVGLDYKNNDWQDDGFIMDKGLKTVIAAIHLEEAFHDLVEKALNILGKKNFIIAFDDVDVNMKKGWPILETIRKYFTTPQLITILSGNIKFYRNNIRIHQWSQLEKLVDMEQHDREKYRNQVNEIEGQYLLKVFKAENRIHLYSILEATNIGKVEYHVKCPDENKSKLLKDRYEAILNANGIIGSTSVNIFTNYLMCLSVRTQIQFLRNIPDKTIVDNIKKVDAFLSRMYASNIDVELIANNPKMLNVVILNYLLGLNIMPDTYLLMPTSDNENVNACVTGLTFLFSEQIIRYSYPIFDYIIRIGYIRNIIQSITEQKEIFQICKYAGAFQDMSLKNILGLCMAYTAAFKSHSLKEHIALFGLARTAKDGEKKIDSILNQDNINNAQRIIGSIPLFSLKNTSNNESRLYYSVFMLLASIGQLCKNVNSEEDIQKELRDLMLHRYYPMVSRDGETIDDNIDEIDIIIKPYEHDETEDKLINSIYEWINKYKEMGIILPPYIIGRIVTRFFYSAQKITCDTLGMQMHRSIIAFLNSCLVEEARENLNVDKKSGKSHESFKLNTSNAINSDDLFVNNWNLLTANSAGNNIKLTKWLIDCPLIWSFISIDTLLRLNEIENKVLDKSEDYDVCSMYDLLNEISIKQKRIDKIKFNKSNFLNIYRILDELGINKEILNQNENEALLKIKNLDLFLNVNLLSLRAYIKYIKNRIK